MKFSLRFIAVAAAFGSAGVAYAENQPDPARVAELKCALTGICGDEAVAEGERESDQLEGVETRGAGILGSRAVSGAQRRGTTTTTTPPRRTTTTRAATTTRRSTSANSGSAGRSRTTAPRTRTRRSVAPVIQTAAAVTPELKRSAPLFVTFVKGKSQLTESAQKEIATLLEVNKQAKEQGVTMKLRLEGHASRTGREPRNVELSQERASAVREALIAGGFADDQLVSEGYGSSRPIEGVADIKPSNKANQRVVAVPLN
ncbi:MAG: OmpA family protein [Erythrobacter sp.]